MTVGNKTMRFIYNKLDADSRSYGCALAKAMANGNLAEAESILKRGNYSKRRERLEAEYL